MSVSLPMRCRALVAGALLCIATSGVPTPAGEQRPDEGALGGRLVDHQGKAIEGAVVGRSAPSDSTAPRPVGCCGRARATRDSSSHALHSLKLSFTRCYLLKCTDGYFLIDTSYPGYYSQFEKKLANLGIATSDIKYVLLTHHHDDHAGFAAELVRRTGCRVIAHRNAASPLKQGKPEGDGEAANLLIEIIFKLYTLIHREYTFPPLTLTDRDILIDGNDDTLLRRLGIDGVILHTPGHSTDSISVLLSDGSAFVGDAAMNFLRWTGVGHRPVFFEDINTVHQSWRKLRQRGAKVVYPSHGRPFSAAKLVAP